MPPFENRIWQRNYYEHITRNEKSYYQIAEYIRNNPLECQDAENLLFGALTNYNNI